MMYKEQEIIDWAEARGILEAADKLAQATKTMEEAVELNKHNTKDLPIIDDIGDVYVTIVLQAKLNGTTVEETLDIIPYDPVFDNDSTREIIAYILSITGDMIGDIINEHNYSTSECIANIYTCLLEIAERKGLKIEDCIDHAYNEIADRTGKMVDGVFVKDE